MGIAVCTAEIQRGAMTRIIDAVEKSRQKDAGGHGVLISSRAWATHDD